jgi:hypothetical protein
MRSKLSRTSVAIATVVAIAVTFSAVGVASTSQTAGQARHGVQSIHITSVTAQDAIIDAPPADFSVGDVYVVSEDLFKGTKQVGDAGGDCTTVRIADTASVVWCTETFRLAEGQIVAQGLVTFDPAVGGTEFTWAITGGTGAYSTARGEVDIAESNGGVNSDLHFRITR